MALTRTLSHPAATVTLSSDERFFTIYGYDGGGETPVGTLQRPRVIGADKLWRTYATDGTEKSAHRDPLQAFLIFARGLPR